MQVEILGSGGAVTTPRPGCQCPVCVEARARDVPYSRGGPSVFVHGPNVLLDTPEEIKHELNRSRVTRIDGCFYSHWHPDHVMGRRVWETRNLDAFHVPPQHAVTDIYLPPQVAADFRTWLGSWEHFAFMQRQGTVRLHELQDGETIRLNGTTITPLALAESYVYAFLFEDGDKRLLIAMDELHGWQPPDRVHGVDLAVIPMGLTEFNPLTGARSIPADHPVLRVEATFEQTLDMLRQMQPKRAILSHIEEPFGLSHDDLAQLATRLQADGLPVTFAYDTMLIEV